MGEKWDEIVTPQFAASMPKEAAQNDTWLLEEVVSKEGRSHKLYAVSNFASMWRKWSGASNVL